MGEYLEDYGRANKVGPPASAKRRIRVNRAIDLFREHKPTIEIVRSLSTEFGIKPRQARRDLKRAVQMLAPRSEADRQALITRGIERLVEIGNMALGTGELAVALRAAEILVKCGFDLENSGREKEQLVRILIGRKAPKLEASS